MILPNTIARDLAGAFSSLKELGVNQRQIYSDILRATLERHPEFWGVWSIWEPDALDGRDHAFVNQAGHDSTGRYAPLWKRTSRGLSLEPNVGYNEPGVGDYYLIPLRQQREVTMAPYEYCPADGHKSVIMSHVAPIFHRGRCVGVAGFDVQAPKHRNISSKPQPIIIAALTQSLSPREREVLAWVSQGKSNPEIGIILNISRHTVRHHLEKIFAKLGVENRQAAIRCAMEPFLRGTEGNYM